MPDPVIPPTPEQIAEKEKQAITYVESLYEGSLIEDGLSRDLVLGSGYVFSLLRNGLNDYTLVGPSPFRTQGDPDIMIEGLTALNVLAEIDEHSGFDDYFGVPPETDDPLPKEEPVEDIKPTYPDPDQDESDD